MRSAGAVVASLLSARCGSNPIVDARMAGDEVSGPVGDACMVFPCTCFVNMDAEPCPGIEIAPVWDIAVNDNISDSGLEVAATDGVLIAQTWDRSLRVDALSGSILAQQDSRLFSIQLSGNVLLATGVDGPPYPARALAVADLGPLWESSVDQSFGAPRFVAGTPWVAVTGIDLRHVVFDANGAANVGQAPAIPNRPWEECSNPFRYSDGSVGVITQLTPSNEFVVFHYDDNGDVTVERPFGAGSKACDRLDLPNGNYLFADAAAPVGQRMIETDADLTVLRRFDFSRAVFSVRDDRAHFDLGVAVAGDQVFSYFGDRYYAVVSLSEPLREPVFRQIARGEYEYQSSEWTIGSDGIHVYVLYKTEGNVHLRMAKLPADLVVP
jgi:hypothetical protein